MKIDIYDKYGSSCVSLDVGQDLYKILYNALISKDEVLLDFNNVEILATPFFNAAIGQLLKDFSESTVRKYIRYKNKHHDLDRIVNKVIKNAVFYYSNDEMQKGVEAAIRRNIKKD